MELATGLLAQTLESRGCFDQSVTYLAQDTDQAFAVLLVGLDHFKALNDTLGPAVGDQLLNISNKRLLSALREKDRVLRMPCGEFAILLHPVQSLEVAGIVADRLVDLLQRTFLVGGQVINLTARVGVALAPQSGADGETLLRHAGIALQCAKSFGPGEIRVFEPAMEDRLVGRHTLIADLRRALLLHQLEVFYQPQVDLASGALIGFEALLRWRHPELGWISPADFIPIAEENGLIPLIGDWVLRTACQEAAKLPANIRMAVNVSPLQFRTGSLLGSIEDALTIAGLPANRLEIEITEGVLFQNGDEVVAILDDLRAMGVRLAMDDFGTGYSSLGQLSKLPFGTIKIDRSLIGGGPKQRPIVRAIAMLATALGMSTLAEGIETEEQLMNTRSDGCTSAQGYLFGNAIPASQLGEVLAHFMRPRSTNADIFGLAS
jgi:diguanylate cyclase (GGDEF)-like protein